ncbi:MAG TPA: hypothetical protein VD866_24380 [Urbifossiella sp.]|nr:hypothetical protein [Urbifossiella sp.]
MTPEPSTSGSPTPHSSPLTRRGRVALLVALAACGLVAVAAYPPAARWWTRSRGEGLTADDARGRMPLDLPPGASDVRYYLHTQPDKVLVLDFAVDEFKFLVWASSHGWAPELLRTPVTITPRLGFGDRKTTVNVADGYGFRNHRDQGAPDTVIVVYDRLRRRAFYSYFSAPQR